MLISQILIVDDNEADQFLNKIVIEEHDPSIEVLSAFDGNEALEMLKSNPNKQPDIILLDINMPGMSGLEFLEEYRLFPAQSSVIVMLTSSIQNKDKKACMAYDFVKKFFSKPLEVSDLEELSLL